MSTHQNEKELGLEPETTSAETQATIEDVSRQLPPQLWARLSTLQPGDVQTVVQLVQQYPEFSDSILQSASKTAGNQAVIQAMEQLTVTPVQVSPGRGRPPEQDFSAEGFKYEGSALECEGGDQVAFHLKFILEHPHLRTKVMQGFFKAHYELYEELQDRLTAAEKAQKKSGPSEKEITEAQSSSSGATNSEAEGQERSARPQEEKKEAAWVVGAKRFNAAHEEEVNEFNRVTKDACVDSDGVLDPALVSDWQARHGIQPDGRVGPATVDAARRAAGIGRPPGPMTAEDLASLE